MKVMELAEQLDNIDIILHQIMGMITDAVEDQYKLPRGIVYRDIRTIPVPEARQMSIFLIHHITKKKPAFIGRVFRRDITNISYSLRTIRNLFDSNPLILERFMMVCDVLELDQNYINQILTKH
jgi:chromosomal replication initiation ATPase DnaA